MKKSLSISLLWKISGLVIASLLVLGYFSISKVNEHSRSTFVKDTSETVDTLLTFVGNTNSVMMQQLRSYTMLDDIGYSEKNPEIIQEMLVRKAGKRYKFFAQIAYVDYASGLAYRDSGEVSDVSSTSWFQIMKNQRKQNKGLQLYADVDSSFLNKIVYPICKDAEPKDSQGYCCGFFVGFVPISYMQVYFDKIKGKSLDAPEGFPLLLNKKREILCSPDESMVGTQFINSENVEIDSVVSEFILNPLDKDENNKQIIISGKVAINGTSYTAVAGRLAGTEWTLAILTPDSTIEESGRILAIVIAAGGIFALIFILVMTTLIFRVSFKPLSELNVAFTNIASGDADLRTRLHEGRNDEIGQIQKSFNVYVAQLQDMIRDIGRAREGLVAAEANLDVSMKRFQKQVNVVSESSSTIKSEINVQANYISSYDSLVNTAVQHTAQINKYLVEQSQLIKTADKAQSSELKGILVAMTGNLKKINDALKVIYSNGKSNVEAVATVRKSTRNAMEAIEKLDTNVTDLEETKKELESLIKESSQAVVLISERVEGFRY